MPHFFPEKFKTLEKFSEHFDAYRAKADGADIYFASYPAGMVIDPHTHDSDNYGIVTKGALCMTVDGKESRYTVGQWYSLPAKTLHSARFEEDTAIIEAWFKV